nr:ribonuclease H-like domain, Gag-pre-integrase domain protein [Tanacetum cinerariifolium]
MGLGYGFTKKACFVCGIFSHLIRDYDFHEKRMSKQVELNKQKAWPKAFTSFRIRKPPLYEQKPAIFCKYLAICDYIIPRPQIFWRPSQDPARTGYSGQGSVRPGYSSQDPAKNLPEPDISAKTRLDLAISVKTCVDPAIPVKTRLLGDGTVCDDELRKALLVPTGYGLPAMTADMNQNQMQQQTNLQPASVSTSVGSGTSCPSVSATNQDGASSSKDWIDNEFMRNLMT